MYGLCYVLKGFRCPMVKIFLLYQLLHFILHVQKLFLLCVICSQCLPVMKCDSSYFIPLWSLLTFDWRTGQHCPIKFVLLFSQKGITSSSGNLNWLMLWPETETSHLKGHTLKIQTETWHASQQNLLRRTVRQGPPFIST